MRSARKYLNISGGHSCKNKRREERKNSREVWPVFVVKTDDGEKFQVNLWIGTEGFGS